MINLVIRVGAEVIQYCFRLEAQERGELNDRTHCHEESNSLHSTDLVAFLKCPSLKASKQCSKTLDGLALRDKFSMHNTVDVEKK